MKKVVLALLIPTLFCVSAFAQSDISIQSTLSFIPGNEGNFLSRVGLATIETTYADDQASGFTFRFGLGADMFTPVGGENLSYGISAELLAGYAVHLNRQVRLDFLAGANVLEASLVQYIKDRFSGLEAEFSPSFVIYPMADVSVLFGLGSFSLRVGLKAGYQFAVNPNWDGPTVSPYITVGRFFLIF